MLKTYFPPSLINAMITKRIFSSRAPANFINSLLRGFRKLVYPLLKDSLVNNGMLREGGVGEL
jgi:hypothetical protein